MERDGGDGGWGREEGGEEMKVTIEHESVRLPFLLTCLKTNHSPSTTRAASSE